MDPSEKHEREMVLNAHIAWSITMWGSAEVAKEKSIVIPAYFSYYYSVFHMAFALINTDHTYNIKDTREIKHSKVESWLGKHLAPEMIKKYSLLRKMREITSYLGVDQPHEKLQIVRGHEFIAKIDDKSYSLFELAEESSRYSKDIIVFINEEITKACKVSGMKCPGTNYEYWIEEYMQEDYMKSVVPRNESGIEVLTKGLSLLKK